MEKSTLRLAPRAKQTWSTYVGIAQNGFRSLNQVDIVCRMAHVGLREVTAKPLSPRSTNICFPTARKGNTDLEILIVRFFPEFCARPFAFMLCNQADTGLHH